MSFFSGRKTPKAPRELPDELPSYLPDASPNPPRPPQTLYFETVIGSHTTLKGELHCPHDIRIDGAFEGVLEIQGNILVGETGKVIADITAKSVVVAGAVRGEISGRKVQLLRTARVWGNINAASITTEEGAFIDGKLTMSQHDAALTGMPTVALPAIAEQSLEVVEGEPVLDEQESA